MDIVKGVNDFYYHMSLYELQVMNGNDYYNGLSYNSILYINVMEQMKECTVSKIADALKITKSAVTLKINELVKQGVVIKKTERKRQAGLLSGVKPSHGAGFRDIRPGILQNREGTERKIFARAA